MDFLGEVRSARVEDCAKRKAGTGIAVLANRPIDIRITTTQRHRRDAEARLRRFNRSIAVIERRADWRAGDSKRSEARAREKQSAVIERAIPRFIRNNAATRG